MANLTMINQGLSDVDSEPVLAVDLDGTLLLTDSLLESVMALVRERSAVLGDALWTLLQGRAAFKAWISAQVRLDVNTLPLNQTLVEWLLTERDSGRRLILVTAADRRIAEAVAASTGLFDEVLASDGAHNLKGQHKAALLVERFGACGFDYVGDALADLPVWRAARRAYVVGRPQIVQAAHRVAAVERVFPPEHTRLSRLPQALRLHQWVKNLLIFLPLLAAHQIGDGATLMRAVLAFLAFGMTASAVYLLNDLLDLPADRRHPTKCRRPFAAGDLPLAWGLWLVPLLLGGATLISLSWLPILFLAVLGGYFILTTAYSFVLKRVPILDVMMLASLYTIRVVAEQMPGSDLTSPTFRKRGRRTFLHRLADGHAADAKMFSDRIDSVYACSVCLGERSVTVVQSEALQRHGDGTTLAFQYSVEGAFGIDQALHLRHEGVRTQVDLILQC